MVAVDWPTSAAKILIEDDLRSGVLPAHRNELSAKEAWEHVYQHLVEFHGVEYEHFRERLNATRKSFRKKRANVNWDAEAIAHDRALHPRRTIDRRGNRIFSMTEAKDLLLADVKAGKHLQMEPKKLQATGPPIYREFDLSVFQQKIHQTVRRIKFENWLEMKREEKEKAREKAIKNRNKKMPGKRRKRK